MAGVVDTNLLLYTANADAPEHASAADFLSGTADAPGLWYLTEGILYEFLRVSTHPRVFPRPLAWRDAFEFVSRLLDSDVFDVLTATEKHWEFLPRVLEALHHPAGNLFFDIRTVVLMREHGVRRIYTADTDFLQFPEIEVVDPLRER